MHVIEGVLSRDELDAALAVVEKARFVDGRSSAGAGLSERKQNLQLARANIPAQELETLDRAMLGGLQRSALFQSLALPRRFRAPLYNRYEPGMHYGEHVDAGIFQGPSPLRADLSVTIFLSDPESYDGGELVVGTDPETQRSIRLPAGCAALYASTEVHHVAPVTRGCRIAAVTWVQSYVRDALVRGILHDLNWVISRLGAEARGGEEATRLSNAYQNLLRRFAEP